MARKNVKQRYDYYKRVDKGTTIQFGNSSDLTWIC